MLLQAYDLRHPCFDVETAKDVGMSYQETYANAKPFPSIVIEDFVNPELLAACLEYFPSEPDPDTSSFDGMHERRKRGFLPERLHPYVRSIFYAFNSRPFIEFLEGLTGIAGLIPDPYFGGGGFHEVRQGGFLDIHADFNLHPILKLERRINVLIYLNRDWRAEYGGALELWAGENGPCIRKVVPEFNRAVIFSTTSESYHGNPEPVRHPQGLARRSIALYYYTATWDSSQVERSTRFAGSSTQEP